MMHRHGVAMALPNRAGTWTAGWRRAGTSACVASTSSSSSSSSSTSSSPSSSSSSSSWGALGAAGQLGRFVSSSRVVRHKEGKHPVEEPPSMFASTEDKTLEELQAELDRINQEIEAYQASEEGKAARDAELEYVNPQTGEIGGPRGPEPTRYGDYAYAGRVTDF